MKDIITGVLMMAGAVVGMIVLVAGISLAIFSPFILLAWLIIEALT